MGLSIGIINCLLPLTASGSDCTLPEHWLQASNYSACCWQWRGWLSQASRVPLLLPPELFTGQYQHNYITASVAQLQINIYSLLQVQDFVLIDNTWCWKSARSPGQASVSNKGMCCLSNLPKCSWPQGRWTAKAKGTNSSSHLYLHTKPADLWSLCVMLPSCLKYLRYIFSITILGRQP